MRLTGLVAGVLAVLSASPTLAAVFTDTFDYDGAPRWPWVVRNEAPRVENGRLLSTSRGSPRDALVTAFDGDRGLRNYRLEVDVDPLENLPGSTWPDAVVAVRTNGWYRGSDGGDGDAYQIDFLRKNALDARVRQKGPVNYVSVSRTEDGRSARLAHTMLDDLPTTPFRVAVTVRDVTADVVFDDVQAPVTGAFIDVTVDGVRAIAALDPDPLPYGGIGLFTIWEARTYFDAVALTTLGESEVVPLPAALPLLATAMAGLGITRRISVDRRARSRGPRTRPA